MTSGNLERRFGIIAIEQGYITLDQLVDALRIQIEEELEKKTHRLVGEILIDQGVMNRNQTQNILKLMGIFKSID